MFDLSSIILVISSEPQMTVAPPINDIFGLGRPAEAASLVSQSTSLYADGRYVGTAADAYYGVVQVQANIQQGYLVSVKVLKYPNDRSTSRFINSQAVPVLVQEAIAAQAAQMDVVSGATLTSEAFMQSLADALNQATTSAVSAPAV